MAPAAAQTAPPLRLVAAEWPPYVDSSLPESGVAVDVARQVLAHAGYRSGVRLDERRRSYEGARVGIYDAVIAAWPSPREHAAFVLSDPYLVSTLVVVQRRGSSHRFEKLSDLEGRIIGTLADHTYGEGFDRARDLIRVPGNHLIQNLQRLVDGYVDAVVGDQWAIRFEIARFMRSAAPKLEILPLPVDTRTLHLAVHRSHPQAGRIVADFNAALADMRADGSRQRILERHVEYLRPIADLPL